MPKKKAATKEVFRVEAQGDVLYIDAFTLVEAKLVLRQRMGDIPESLLAWSGPVPLPAGEEALS